MTLTQKILKVLERVPVPMLPDVARAVDGIMTVYQVAHAEAVAAGDQPPTTADVRQAVIDACVAAAEPWQRIAGRAVSGRTGD